MGHVCVGNFVQVCMLNEYHGIVPSSFTQPNLKVILLRISITYFFALLIRFLLSTRGSMTISFLHRLREIFPSIVRSVVCLTTHRKFPTYHRSFTMFLFFSVAFMWFIWKYRTMRRWHKIKHIHRPICYLGKLHWNAVISIWQQVGKRQTSCPTTSYILCSVWLLYVVK